MKTKFDKKIIIKLIENSLLKVPGIKCFDIDVDKSDFANNVFFINIYFYEKTLNLLDIACEARQLVYFDLNQQLNDEEIKVNITIGC